MICKLGKVHARAILSPIPIQDVPRDQENHVQQGVQSQADQKLLKKNKQTKKLHTNKNYGNV